MDRLSIAKTQASLETSTTVTAFADGGHDSGTASITTMSSAGNLERPDQTDPNLAEAYASANARAHTQRHSRANRDAGARAMSRSRNTRLVSRFQFLEERVLFAYMSLQTRVRWIPAWTPDARQAFLRKLVARHWDSLTEDAVESLCRALKLHQPLVKFLFPVAGQPPRYIHRALSYAALPWKVSWPRLPPFMDPHVFWLPYHPTISFTVDILPDRDTLTLTALVDGILRATRPNARASLEPTQKDIDEFLDSLDVDAQLEGVLVYPSSNHRDNGTCGARAHMHLRLRHPVWPYLWFAVYLADANLTAARRLIDGGIVDNVRALYDTDFPDAREGRSRYSRHELVQLCYVLLRVLFRNKVGYHGARKEAETLMEFMRGDIMAYERMLSARWHDPDVLYRDEVDAEWREQRYFCRAGG